MCSDGAVGVQIMGKDGQNHSSYCKSVHESTTTSRGPRGHDRELPQVESPFFACDVIADITHRVSWNQASMCAGESHMAQWTVL